MREPRLVRIAGDRRWAELAHKDLRDIQMDFEMVSYNPIRKNPSVMIESLLQLIPFLAENENVDIRQLTEDVVSGMGLSRRIMVPQAELEAMQQDAVAQEQDMVEAQQQAALGGAAGGKPYIEAKQMQAIQQAIAEMPLEDAMRFREKVQKETGVEVPLPQEMQGAMGGMPAPEGEA